MAVTELIGSVAASSGTTNISESSVVGKEDFLKLLVTQLQNQDPLNPSESTEFTAQLAQFSSLEQLTNVNENLEYLHLYQASINNAQSVDFIGKTVKAAGDSISVSDGVSEKICFDLPKDASGTLISIYDDADNLVATLNAGSLNSGEQSLTWDGTDSEGNSVSDGDYTFKVAATDADGNTIEVSTFTTARVTGVTFENGTTYLMAGGKRIPLGDVVEVLETPQS